MLLQGQHAVTSQHYTSVKRRNMWWGGDAGTKCRKQARLRRGGCQATQVQ